ncbi:MAG: T9SS type A sorting domain-containing protein [Saprospiraceae bacterium]
MKKIFTIAILFNFILMFGQNELCTPDQQYAGEEANLYPEPYHERLNPNGGVLDSACINKYYSFVFTAVIPDSFPTNFGTLALDSIVILPNPLVNAPAGINVSCNPPNCKFDSGTLGCLELYGVPSSSNTPKVYDISILVKVSLLDGLLLINDTLPRFLSDSAHYYLPLFEENSPNCNSTSVDDEMLSKVECELFPNPVSDYLTVTLSSDNNIEGEIMISDLSGRILATKDIITGNFISEYEFSVSGFPSGVYILSVNTGNQVIKEKLIIN